MADTFSSRLLVNVLGIPGILLILWFGGPVFGLFITLVMLLALWEFYAINRLKNTRPQVWAGLLATLLLAAGYYFGFPSGKLVLVLALLLMLVILLVELFRNLPAPTTNLAITIAGIVYIPLLLGTLIALRNWDSEMGTRLTFGVFLTVWTCDSAAYGFGRKWGRTRILERVSPKKTWMGGVGGLSGAGVAAGVLYVTGFLGPVFTWWDVLALTLIVGILGQAGDFVQSLVKRDMGVKDSGSLLRGHGGVFDRFDSLIFAGACTFIYIQLTHTTGVFS